MTNDLMREDPVMAILEGWIEVTEQSHTNVFEAFEAISHDCGAGAGHKTYSVPPKWAWCIQGVEDALASLNPDELQEFCIGDQAVADQLAARSPGLTAAQNMLREFFNDWGDNAPLDNAVENLIVETDPDCHPDLNRVTVAEGQLWTNSRNGHTYKVISTPRWSDTPPEEEAAGGLEAWVVLRNTYSQADYCRSLKSFAGRNRNGDWRFRIKSWTGER